MRLLNRAAFKMEQIYQFKLDKYIQYYDYDLCDENSGDEYSDDEDKSPKVICEDHPSESENNPFGTGSSISSLTKRSSRHKGKLPRTINTCLDAFSRKMAKTKSFHQKLSNNKLV